MTASPLEIRGLVRRYGRLVAVDRLDLTVRPGEILGFLGPNGAGKTTTLCVCSGLLRPDEGEILVGGASLLREPLVAKRRLGFAPDRPFLYDRLTAREFLEFIGALYHVPQDAARRRGDAMLDRLELGDAADALIESYSLGMRQKVSIAAAMLHEPPLLMLDEPLGGLDPHATRALKDMLREHSGRGNGIVVSTHLLDVAERLCDRVVILHHGRRLAEGTLEELRGDASVATLEDVFLTLTREGP